MPVTARLSKLVYDRLGDEIVNEIVDWFNQVDTTYRNGLRELNELNFVRFDAKLEQRITELEARIDKRVGRLEVKLEQEIGRIEAKLDRRVTELEAKFEGRFTGLEARLDQRITMLDAKIDRTGAELRESLEKGLKEQVRWQFLAWAALLVPIIGLWFRA